MRWIQICVNCQSIDGKIRFQLKDRQKERQKDLNKKRVWVQKLQSFGNDFEIKKFWVVFINDVK